MKGDLTMKKKNTTDHYRLVRTDDGWRGNPDDTFTDDGDCRFELHAEAIVMAAELDVYREFLAILSDEISELRQSIGL